MPSQLEEPCDVAQNDEGAPCVMPQERLNINSIEEYRRGVSTLMSLKSPKIISNSEPAHAAVLFEAFFKSAEERVRIFCKNLNKEVFGNDFVLHSAKTAVSRGVQIHIVLQESSPEESKFAQWIVNGPANAGVKLVRAASDSAKISDVNFTVMDKRAVRFEENKNHIHAWASMYCPTIAETLCSKFDNVFSLGSAL